MNELEYVPALKPKKCCVRNCVNRHSKRHRFPKNDPEIFKIWLAMIEPPNYKSLSVEEIYQKYYVCAEHFNPKCIFPSLRHNRGLKKNSVPTHNIPGFHSFNLEPITGKGALLIDGGYVKGCIPAESNNVLNEPGCNSSTSEETVIPEHSSDGKRKFSSTFLEDCTQAESNNAANQPCSNSNASEKVVLLENSAKRKKKSPSPPVTFPEGIILNWNITKDLNHETVNKIEHTGKREDSDEEDRVENSTIKDENVEELASNDIFCLVNTNTNLDFISRKEMFKQFVIKIIDDIMNEEDLAALEKIFATAVPLPSEIQNNMNR